MAALQYVRKVSGYRKPSKANEDAFQAAVNEISATTSKLIARLETTAPLREQRRSTGVRHRERE